MSNDAREAAWQAWLDANPNKPICTHWREAFLAGYDAAQAALAQAREEGARAMQEVAANVAYGSRSSYGAHVAIRALDPASISAQGGERETE